MMTKQPLFGQLLLTVVSVVSFANSNDECEGATPPTVLSVEAAIPGEGLSRQEAMHVRRNLMLRELVRQQILITAREDYGMATRDEALGEILLGQGPESIRLQVDTVSRYEQGIAISIRSTDKTIWKGEIACQVGPLSIYRELPPKLHAWAKAELQPAFDALGCHKVSRENPQSMKVSAEATAALSEVNLFRQYEGVRLIHAEISEMGESTARLAGLVRGYAHLGQLSQNFLTCLHYSFRARSILYAQRLIELSPRSPIGWWYRSYAYSLAGMQRWAIDDMKKAAEQQPASGQQIEKPLWHDLLRSYVTYDFATLRERTRAGDELSQLAGLLWFVSVETSKSEAMITEVGVEVLGENSDDMRVWSGMFSEAGLGYQHQITGQAFSRFGGILHRRGAKLTSVPTAVRRKLEDDEELLSSPNAVSAKAREMIDFANQENDLQEPSVAVLGKLIEEQSILNVTLRAFFMRDYWGVDSSGFLSACEPAISKHRFAGLIRSLEFGRQTNPARFAKALANTSMKDADFSSTHKIVARVPHSINIGSSPRNEVYQGLFTQSACLEFEYFIEVERMPSKEGRVQMAKWFYDVSPHSPYRFYVLIREDWDGSRDAREKEDWEGTYGNHPLVARALGEQFEAQGDQSRAVEYYRRSLDLVQDIDVYVQLAKLQYRQNKDDKQWLKTLEQALEARDYGLGHSKVNAHVAATLMESGDYEIALPYAEAAAESYSCSALLCLVDCYEGLGQINKAEAVMRASLERYAHDYATYIWMLIHQVDGYEAQWKKWRTRYAAEFPSDARTLSRADIYHAIYTGKKEEAWELSEIHADEFSYGIDLLTKAFLAEELGRSERVPALLKLAAEWTESGSNERPFEGVVEGLKLPMAVESLNNDTLHDALSQYEGIVYPATKTFLGWHLMNRGHPDLAKQFFQQIVGGTELAEPYLLLAIVKMIESGEDWTDSPRYYPQSLAR